MAGRDYKYIDMDRVNKRIEEGEIEDDGASPEDVLYETLLDLLQLAENEGMTEDEVDLVVRRVNDYRANRNRERFRLHTSE
jgi:hypothetical protein